MFRAGGSEHPPLRFTSSEQVASSVVVGRRDDDARWADDATVQRVTALVLLDDGAARDLGLVAHAHRFGARRIEGLAERGEERDAEARERVLELLLHEAHTVEEILVGGAGDVRG